MHQGLGRALVASIADKHEQTVSRWAAGTSNPSADAAEALRGAHQAFILIAGESNPSRARAWFQASNPSLGGTTPVEMIRRGRIKRALKVAEAFGAANP